MSVNLYNAERYLDPTAYEALMNIEREAKRTAYKPLVFISSPFAGNIERNTRRARDFCRFAVSENCIPIAPHLLFPRPACPVLYRTMRGGGTEMKKALNIPLEEFLRPFFGPGERICLRIFDDRKTGTFKGAKLETTLSGLPGLMDSLKKHNEKNRGIYFVVNFGGHEDSEITRINAQFMECDELPLDEQLKQIEAFPLEPSLIVKTRKSLHTYWLIKDGDVATFRRVQKRLVAQFHGDRSCVNESRVLRLPGFYHCKEEPVMVECIHFHPELRYTQAELEQYLPQISEEPAAPAGPAAKGTQQGLSLVLKRCDFIRHCRYNGATLPEHDWYAMITNLAVFEGGERAIHELSAPYPGYKAAETQEKIQHFLGSGTKPITCKAIAEKGFVCPKLENGACTCKAPAALCYLPLSLDELREALSAIPAQKSPVENMRSAKEFVRESLYNIEPLDAGTFIEYELREHFRLKAADTKALSAYQKELYKAYAAKKETRQAAEENGLPEWYEVTERGGLRFLSGLLANHLAENMHAFYTASSFFFYQGGVYRESEDMVAAAKVRELMLPKSASMQAINDTVGQWKMLIMKPVQEINSNPFILNLQNGLYHTLDNSFKAHTPEYFSTVQLKAAYAPDASCPLFLRYLESMLAEEEGVTVRDDLFLRYKEYCGNAGMKPVSQTNFNKELEAGFPEITRGRDKLSKRRIWRGITYCEGGVEAD